MGDSAASSGQRSTVRTSTGIRHNYDRSRVTPAVGLHRPQRPGIRTVTKGEGCETPSPYFY